MKQFSITWLKQICLKVSECKNILSLKKLINFNLGNSIDKEKNFSISFFYPIKLSQFSELDPLSFPVPELDSKSPSSTPP